MVECPSAFCGFGKEAGASSLPARREWKTDEACTGGHRIVPLAQRRRKAVCETGAALWIRQEERCGMLSRRTLGHESGVDLVSPACPSADGSLHAKGLLASRHADCR